MNNHGQNVIEYILLVVGVVIVMIFFLKPGGKMQNSVEYIIMNKTLEQLNKASNEIR